LTVSEPNTGWSIRATHRLRRLAFFALLVLCWPSAPAIGADLERRTRPTRDTVSATAEEAAEGGEKRLREGTKIETTGYFRSTGDRVTFYSDAGKVRYRGLENLMLERIARAIEDNPGQLDWSVMGIVTEYRGANFILVTHATFKANDGR
jgi:hypothetical protein